MFGCNHEGKKILSEVLPEDVNFLRNHGYTVTVETNKHGNYILAVKGPKTFILMKYRTYLLDYSAMNHRDDPIEGSDLANLLERFEKLSG